MEAGTFPVRPLEPASSFDLLSVVNDAFHVFLAQLLTLMHVVPWIYTIRLCFLTESSVFWFQFLSLLYFAFISVVADWR